ncbi:MAG: hypothetical protein ACTSR2_01670 [Candidatus Hodarchaeales archaeon]
MTNLDEFFGDERSKNIETLMAVTKKFFVFVSQLAEIVDELERNFAELDKKVNQLLQGSGTSSFSPPTIAPPVQKASAPPAPPSISPASSPAQGLPTPPAPVQASTPMSTGPSPLSPPSPSPLSPPSPSGLAAPSGLPPLPGQSQQPSTPSLGAPTPGAGRMGQPPATGAPAPRPSPMSLKAQMNMELKEAFARIRKGWDEES